MRREIRDSVKTERKAEKKARKDMYKKVNRSLLFFFCLCVL